ncbi:CPBP family intramembrane glutamic endopeptidase [Haloarchaeobius sp. TZWSO28]|uniref:CPBP family intramembrane glutamic endopeptidase n=1 Tax=Haloarchaeobius sp. TZWSO28 TaxID=3446119 RepID=UPI003EBD8109
MTAPVETGGERGEEPSAVARNEALEGIDWPLVGFFALAFAIAWGTLGILAVIAEQSGVESAIRLLEMGEVMQFEGADLVVPGWVVYLLTRLADFSFSIAGVVVVVLTAGRAGLRELFGRLVRFDFPRVWYLVALLPVGLFALSALVFGLGTEGVFGSLDLSLAAIQAALFALNGGLLVTLFLRGPMGEELGLRGFALPRLQARMSAFRASAIIGAFWASWHLPVLVGRGVVTMVVFLLVAFSLSFVFTWLFNGARGSLVPPLLFHAFQNSEELFETVFPALVGTEWELVSTLSLLVFGLAVGVHLWRTGRRAAS